MPLISIWGISSYGRAPALHAGSAGIDTQILQDFPCFFFLQHGTLVDLKLSLLSNESLQNS